MARIALVDDQHDILHLLHVCLSRIGHETAAAASKKELINLLNNFNPQLIILDVNLGPENGRDICREIKNSENHHIPIILYSANNSMLQNHHECQADDVLDKPFEIRDLIAKVNKALGQEKQ